MEEKLRKVRKRRRKQIDSDAAFLAGAISGAPVGDLSDEEMAKIYAGIRKRRKNMRGEK